MNVENGTEAAQFPEKKYINGIFLAVCTASTHLRGLLKNPCTGLLEPFLYSMTFIDRVWKWEESVPSNMWASCGTPSG
jgi:hypothetical protein